MRTPTPTIEAYDRGFLLGLETRDGCIERAFQELTVAFAHEQRRRRRAEAYLLWLFVMALVAGFLLGRL
jgi:hypothetical protein